MVYFGFAIADSMFDETAIVKKETLTPDGVRYALANGYTSCCNGSHSATIHTMRSRFDLFIHIPPTPPQVSLKSGDSIIVMSVRGLPRLTEDRHYTDQEIENATFVFSMWTVQ